MEIDGLEVFPNAKAQLLPYYYKHRQIPKWIVHVNSCLASSPQILTIKPSVGRLLPLAQRK